MEEVKCDAVEVFSNEVFSNEAIYLIILSAVNGVTGRDYRSF